MIDSTTKKRIIAIPAESGFSVKVYSWESLSHLEGILDEEFEIAVDRFKSLKDGDGNEIGGEVVFNTSHDLQFIQKYIDRIE